MNNTVILSFLTSEEITCRLKKSFINRQLTHARITLTYKAGKRFLYQRNKKKYSQRLPLLSYYAYAWRDR